MVFRYYVYIFGTDCKQEWCATLCTKYDAIKAAKYLWSIDATANYARVTSAEGVTIYETEHRC